MSGQDARLLALEEKIAYQDKTIAELNEVVTTREGSYAYRVEPGNETPIAPRFLEKE